MARLSFTSSSSNKDDSLSEFCQYIPLRLSLEERALLTVLERALNVSEYTDHVDVASNRRGTKATRILDGILELCHISTGLAISSGQEQSMLSSLKDVPVVKRKKKKKGNILKRKSKLPIAPALSTTASLATNDPKDNAAFFQTLFEIGRRNKVLNPTSMRTTYGKLLYLCQDAQNPTVAKSLQMSVHKDLVLVGPYLKEFDCEDLLHDPRLPGATRYVADKTKSGKKIAREVIQAAVAEKSNLMEQLVAEYSNKSKLSDENVRRALESISDAIAYVQANLEPVQAMLSYLEDNFDPNKPQEGFSLELSGNARYSSSSYSRYGFSAFSSGSSGGPTLSHSHPTQYTFVWQSLQLWCKVQRNMHKLWVCADEDLLSTSTSYHLYNTGQGLNRVQSCPKVGKVMRSLLSQTQQEAGAPWVGLSVVHLGDRDVPNALVFIDKYTQIPRFLHPLVDFLRSLSALATDPILGEYIDKAFGSTDELKMTVLCDYFKHGFDGSGDDGGSCIDGRLTSSWNWTSRIAKKPYYHAFMLSGFQGFDGDFK
jgi:Protein of unknown function (DUF2009)